MNILNFRKYCQIAFQIAAPVYTFYNRVLFLPCPCWPLTLFHFLIFAYKHTLVSLSFYTES